MRLLGAGTAKAVAVTSNRIGSSALLGWFILGFRKPLRPAEVEHASSKTRLVREKCQRVVILRIITLRRHGIGILRGHANGKILSWVWAEGSLKKFSHASSAGAFLKTWIYYA